MPVWAAGLSSFVEWPELLFVLVSVSLLGTGFWLADGLAELPLLLGLVEVSRTVLSSVVEWVQLFFALRLLPASGTVFLLVAEAVQPFPLFGSMPVEG